MSRSYHVTEKAARVAFVNGDCEPMYQASEKSWVKKKQKQARTIRKAVPEKKHAIPRAIVGREKKRTQIAHAELEGACDMPT